MDYLNLKKERYQNLMLFVGYGTIAIAIAMTTLLLVRSAYGYGLDREGKVIQNGLVFFSSQPAPATITLNGRVNSKTTDTRMNLPEGIYDTEISRTGYQSWKRQIPVIGGKVYRYDYPFLVPSKLESTKIQTFDKAPAIASQSADRRWLLVQNLVSDTTFAVRDLKDPTKTPVEIALPATAFTPATASQSWTAVDWADDNSHVLLLHKFDDKTEYVLLDRTDPEQSVNLSQTITGDYDRLEFMNRKYDKYYLYNSADQSLKSATIGEPAAKPVLNKVINYKTYGDDTILYATDADAPAGKVVIKLKDNDKTYQLKTLPAGSYYPLDLTKYNGSLYTVLGASVENKVSIYKDPIGALNDKMGPGLVPSQVLRVNDPNYISFSNTAQFIMVQNGQQFGIYDIEYDNTYLYTAQQPLDSTVVLPGEKAPHATWMDGNRIRYISGGQAQFFDYDNLNQRSIAPSGPNYLAIYSPDYEFVYTVAPAANGSATLLQTSLLTPADQ